MGAAKSGVICAKWVSWYPYLGYNTNFWVTVAKKVKAKRIGKNDKAGVVRTCAYVHGRFFKHLNVELKTGGRYDG